MGYAIAQAASELGAETTLIAGPTNLPEPSCVRVIHISTTNDLQKAVLEEFKKTDYLIMAAAPADYRPSKIAKSKIKRTGDKLELELSSTNDILKEVDKIKKENQLTVGFALETDNGIVNARKKLKEKGLDLIVLNQPGKDTGFNTDTNRVTIIAQKRKPIEWPLSSKKEIANKLLEFIQRMM